MLCLLPQRRAPSYNPAVFSGSLSDAVRTDLIRRRNACVAAAVSGGRRIRALSVHRTVRRRKGREWLAVGPSMVCGEAVAGVSVKKRGGLEDWLGWDWGVALPVSGRRGMMIRTTAFNSPNLVLPRICPQKGTSGTA